MQSTNLPTIIRPLFLNFCPFGIFFYSLQLNQSFSVFAVDGSSDYDDDRWKFFPYGNFNVMMTDSIDNSYYVIKLFYIIHHVCTWWFTFDFPYSISIFFSKMYRYCCCLSFHIVYWKFLFTLLYCIHFNILWVSSSSSSF